MSRRILAALILSTTSSVATLQAQERWEFEFRAGAAVPTEDPANVSLGTGFGFEGTVAYRLQPHLSVYAGWDWHRFPADGAFVGATSDLEETGYAFGMLFEHPVGRSEVLAIQLRGGGTYNHLEAENNGGDSIGDSGHGLGYEAGVGLAFRMGNSWRLTPGLRFRSLSRDLEIGSTSLATDLRYVALELGFAGRF
jgi:hypothetical protein